MRKWDSELWLLTIEEFKRLPDGTRLKCIDDEYYVKGADIIDLDTRFGCIAYGLNKQLVEEQNLDNDFLMFVLSS